MDTLFDLSDLFFAFDTATKAAYVRLLGPTENLLFFALTISTVFSLVGILITRNVAQFVSLIRLVVGCTAALFFLRTAPYWLGIFADSVHFLGTTAAGLDGIRPSALFDRGIYLGASLLSALYRQYGIAAGAPWNLIMFFLVVLPLGATALRLMLLQFVLLVQTGPLAVLVAAAGTGVTWPLFAAYVRSLANTALQFLLNGLVIGLSFDTAGALAVALNTQEFSLRLLAMVLIVPVLFGWWVMRTVPQLAAGVTDQLLGGNPYAAR